MVRNILCSEAYDQGMAREPRDKTREAKASLQDKLKPARKISNRSDNK